ncbi:MerR family transcriptional regulator [Stomatobaculum longum]|uniref:MerR family transcriptional regulator n=1 Tax=Stomatobaculum longum TaxID=796942 RepID=UPI0006814135|nr:MerR family transcriptional regulator [Stomatobaculum longum]
MKIKDVVELTGTAADTLRYYEKIGLLQIERKNGVRSFSEKNLEQIHMILQLKEAGFLLKEIVFLFTLDDAIQSPMCLNLKDEQVLTDVKDLVFTKLNLTRKKIIRMQESVKILEKMHSKLVNALKSGKMEGYTK